MILTFRANVPNATPAKSPVTITLTPMARAVQELVVWSNTSTLNMSKAGFRLQDKTGRLLIPDAGSWGQENFAAADETNWAAIPSSPLRLDLNEQALEGPPWSVTLSFYNVDATAILVAGFMIVREPFVGIPADQMYEFLSRLGPAVRQAGATDLPIIPDKETPPHVNELVDRIAREDRPFDKLVKRT